MLTVSGMCGEGRSERGQGVLYSLSHVPLAGQVWTMQAVFFLYRSEGFVRCLVDRL